MGVIKYTTDRKFNIGQATRDGWGIEWPGEEGLVGLKLRDRKKPKYKTEIVKTDWCVGTFRVFFKSGGWQCFDHCVEQFEIDRAPGGTLKIGPLKPGEELKYRGPLEP